MTALRWIVLVGALWGAAMICLDCSPGDSLAGGGGSEVVGKLIDETGAPVDGAQVRLVSAAGDSAGDLSQSDTVESGPDGAFVFDSVDTGAYNLYGDYNDGGLVVFVPGVVHDTGRQDIGTCTMRPPGRISGRVTFDQVDRGGVLCYVPGTSFLAVTDSLGNFSIDLVPPGGYRLRVSLSGYLPWGDSVTVVSDSVASVPQISLVRDPAYPPPAPTGLSATYDTLSGTVRLRWNEVDVSDLDGYFVYADTGAGVFRVTARRVDTCGYSWQVRAGVLDTHSVVVTCKVKAVDLNSNESAVYSDPATVRAVSPALVRTTFAWEVIDGGNDSLIVNDTVLVRLAFSNPTRTCSLLVWNADRATTPVRQVELSATSGADTLAYAWPDTGVKLLLARVIDDAGSVWEDSIALVIDEAPVVLPRNTWELIDSMATARRFLAATVLDGKLYALGGAYDRFEGTGFRPAALGTVEMFDPDSGRWVARASMQTARFAHSAAAAAGKIYVMGGMNYNQYFNTIEEYDPADNRWRTMGSMAAVRVGHAAVVVNNRIIVLGGITYNGVDFVVSSSIDEYDPATGTWRRLGSMTVPRAYHQAVEIGGKIYIAGGLAGDTLVGSCDPSASAEVFDPVRRKTGAAAAMSSARSNFCMAAVNGSVVAAGGLGSVVSDSVLDEVEEYDIATDRWSAKASMSVGRHGLAAAALNSRIYVVGGTYYGYYGYGNLRETSRVEVFYP